MWSWIGMRAALGAVALATASCMPIAGTQSPSPLFEAEISVIDDEARSRMTTSWRPGCPVGLDQLRLVTLSHWGLDSEVHTGELVVHRDVADEVVQIFSTVFAARFPIERMDLVDVFGADDDRSMVANNTSAFNCRFVAGTSRWSQHAFGRAIDINPLLNPYVQSDGRIDPPEGAIYADRAPRKGLIRGGDEVVTAFNTAGWSWGGNWANSQDYQHFSRSGN